MNREWKKKWKRGENNNIHHMKIFINIVHGLYRKSSWFYFLFLDGKVWPTGTDPWIGLKLKGSIMTRYDTWYINYMILLLLKKQYAHNPWLEITLTRAAYFNMISLNHTKYLGKDLGRAQEIGRKNYEKGPEEAKEDWGLRHRLRLPGNCKNILISIILFSFHCLVISNLDFKITCMERLHFLKAC